MKRIHTQSAVHGRAAPRSRYDAVSAGANPRPLLSIGSPTGSRLGTEVTPCVPADTGFQGHSSNHSLGESSASSKVAIREQKHFVESGLLAAHCITE